MKNRIDFHPKFFSAMKNYSKEKFLADSMAGTIVAIVAALPLAIAFAIASGLSPTQGLVTSVIAGFIISLLGGSSVQIGGPTGAFIIVIYTVVLEFGLEGLVIATVLAGCILLLMGLFKLGMIIRFIPYPIIVGYTSGIAVTIFTSQIRDFFGLDITSALPSSFLSKWGVYFAHMGTINAWSVAIGIASILIIIFTPKFSKKIPGSLIAIILLTVIAFVLRKYIGVSGIETIGDRFQLSASFSFPSLPNLNMDMVNRVLPYAFTIAVMGAIESLLSATIADGATGDKHNSNTELIAQGIANIVVPFFGGMPATGAVARTMTNISNGGQTPVSGMMHSLVLLLILLFLGSLTTHIPMACLAGVLIIVSYNMSEWRVFKSLMKNSKYDVAVLLTTFLLTVIFDLTIAIEIGLLLAILLFVRRINETTTVSVATASLDLSNEGDIYREEKLELPEGIEVYEIDGPFFFGVANKFEECMRKLGDKPKVRIIRMRKVPFIDTTGLHNLESLYRLSHKENIQIVLSGVNDKVREVIEKSDLAKQLGEENICKDIQSAIEKAKDYI